MTGTTEQDVSVPPSPLSFEGFTRHDRNHRNDRDNKDNGNHRNRRSMDSGINPEGQKPIYQSLSSSVLPPISYLLPPFSSVPFHPTILPSHYPTIPPPMGYGDFAPPSGHHAKKPLTKAQIKKLQQAYAKAGEISDTVKSLEKEEQEKTEKEIDEMMRGII